MQNKRILYTNEQGGLSVIVPAPGCTLEQALAAVPPMTSHEVVDVAEVPTDRIFRNAWFHDVTAAPQKVGVVLQKAKDITHARRRAKREEEFKPHDDIIMKQLPGKSAVEAEAARAAIRTKYDAIQVSVDACTAPEGLKAIIEVEGL